VRRSPVAALLAACLLGGCGGDKHPSPPGAATAAEVPTRCTLVAAPRGDNSAAGTRAAPLRAPSALAARLQPGQTGCLRAGTYGAVGDGYALEVRRGGRRGAPVTIRSYPGERARLTGPVYVARGADHVTLADLDVDDRVPFDPGRQLSLQVDAADTELIGLDVTNRSTKTCVILGSPEFGAAVDTTVRDSVLHDCGDPGNDLLDHAIYVSLARGAQITGNVITRAGGYAVQLYPDAAGTVVRGNVMADNGGGVIFAGDEHGASSGNRVEHNVITGSRLDHDIAIFWGGTPGHDNVARDNCLFGGVGGEAERGAGVALVDNVVADPRYDGDLVPQASECADVLPAGTLPDPG
jgi:hypothetical protein